MIGEWVRKHTAGLFRWLAKRLIATGLTANMVTFLGLVLSGLVGYCAATGRHFTAGLILIMAGLLDGLDGSLARASGLQNPFGAFWDSTLDRLSESVIFLGLMIHFIGHRSAAGVVLVYLAVVGSLLVSYVRARAEGLGVSCRTGFMTRFERIFVLIMGLLSGQALIALTVLVVLSVFTICQRMYLVWAHFHQGVKRPAVAVYGQEGERS